MVRLDIGDIHLIPWEFSIAVTWIGGRGPFVRFWWVSEMSSGIDVRLGEQCFHYM